MITNKKSNKGFTLIEMVIVIAVIAILAAILIPTFAHVINNANAAKLQAQLKNVHTVYVTENAEIAVDGDLLVFEYDGGYYSLDSKGEYTKVSSLISDAATGNASYESGNVKIYDWSANPNASLFAYEAYAASTQNPEAIDGVIYELNGTYYKYSNSTFTEVTDPAIITALGQSHTTFESKAHNVTIHII